MMNGLSVIIHIQHNNYCLGMLQNENKFISRRYKNQKYKSLIEIQGSINSKYIYIRNTMVLTW